MKYLLTLFLFLSMYLHSSAQGEIKIDHVLKLKDFIEVTIEMDKPCSKFELVDLDTLIVTDNRGSLLKETRKYPLYYGYNNGRGITRRYDIPKQKFTSLNISGVMKYFTPSTENNSYFNFGKLKNITSNVNLIDKNILKESPKLYFSIVDSAAVDKVFPGIEYKIFNDKTYHKIDFQFYDIVFAYRYDASRKMMYFINDNPAPGYNNLELEDAGTGIMYVLAKLKNNMSAEERAKIRIELVIENAPSVKKIPFEFLNIIPE